MDNDYLNPLPGKIYISPSLQAFGDKDRRVRIASKVLPFEDGYPISGCAECSHCKNSYVQLCDNWSLIGVQTNGGFTQKISVAKESQIELPDSVSWEQSSLIEPFANSVNAWEISQ